MIQKIERKELLILGESYFRSHDKLEVSQNQRVLRKRSIAGGLLFIFAMTSG
jgi:hypothetical protein